MTGSDLSGPDFSLIVECASLAPSVHNTQPWKFTTNASGVEVRADRDRQLSFLDPTGRQLHISCGAAIEFGYLTARTTGRDCTVELLPEPDRPDLLARLALGAETRPTPMETELAGAIARRYTDRGPYSDRAVPPQVLIDVQTRSAELGVWVRILDRPGERTPVATILAEAEAAEAAEPRYAEELARWVSEQAQEQGMPAAATAPPWPADRVSDVPLRDFTGHDVHRRPSADETPPAVERDTLVLIGTALDDPVSWLLAGRALGWLVLRAAVDGMSTQPLGPAIDLPDSRAALRRELGLVGHPQFLLRMGFGTGRPRTRRKGVDGAETNDAGLTALG
jgi:nitroreductase